VPAAGQAAFGQAGREGVRMDIPRVKPWPEGAGQCDLCGGLGCRHCDGRGWFPPPLATQPTLAALTPESPDWDPVRRCMNAACRKILRPDWVAVYCSNECAYADA